MRCTRSPEWRGLGRSGTELVRTDRGSVTAEAAVALPALLVLVAGAVAVVVALAAQVRCVDAAREVARAAARGEPATVVSGAATTVDPDASAQLTRRDGLVVVRVTLPVSLPLLGHWTVAATAVTTDEVALGLAPQPAG
jgi:hypothetical protein